MLSRTLARLARRDALVPLAVAALSLLVLVVHLHAAVHAPADLDYARTRTSTAGTYRVTYVPESEPIPIGRMQTWTLQVETADGRAVDDAELRFDGGMPQHGHGLPTKPKVTRALGEGRYLLEGVKFNMGGWWTLRVEVVSPLGRDAVTFNLRL